MKYLVAISIILFMGCNPAKKLARHQQQYQTIVDEYNKNHPPRIDTATKFSRGVDSSAFFKRIADSLRAVKEKVFVDVRIKYKDTCTTALDTYQEGYTLGYEIGLYDCNQRLVHDTMFKTITPTDQIAALQRSNAQLQSELSAQKLHDAKEFNWLWPFIISCIVITILTALLIKNFKR